MSTVMPEPRTRVMIVVQASWKDHGEARTASARMEDKSAGGACIRINTPIAPGSALWIRWRFEQFSAIVKYCRQDGREYLVGMQRDATITAIPESPALADPPKREAVRGTEPNRMDPRPVDNTVSRAVQRSSGYSARVPLRQPRHRASARDRPRTQPEDFEAAEPAERRVAQAPQRKEVRKEKKFMDRKWLGLPWHNKPNAPGASVDPSNNATEEKENLMAHASQPPEKPQSHAVREVPTFQVELLPVEEIYRASGVTIPRKGYSVNKVVEMLNSSHIRGLSKEMKRAAVLMALDAAGVSIDQIQRDAKARQDALDAYEAEQKKQAEAEWARKAEEIAGIQAELDSIKAHYTARISRNQEAVAREKANFSNWQSTKQQEIQSMSEAVELCLKPSPPEPASHPPAELSLAASAASASAATKP